jgi:hypothetical protein
MTNLVPLPTSSEHCAVQPFQYVNRHYIRGITSDGKSLVARQILRAPDGTFHIQMELVRFPSECTVQRPTSPKTASGVAMSTGPTPVDLKLTDFNSRESSCGVGIIRPSIERPLQDNGSDSGIDECAVTDNEEDDAAGEVDEEYFAQFAMQQQPIMNRYGQQRNGMVGLKEF